MTIRLVVWPDPLNRWAIWRDWGFSFRPRDLDLRGFGSILADTSQIQKQVVLSRSVAQSHSAPTPSGGWQAVERIVRGDSPSGEVEKPVFLAALSAARGVMHAAVETGHGAWWVTMARPPFDRAEYSYLFLLWQSATEWLLRLAASAGDRLIWPADAIEISLLPVPASIADAPDAIEYVVHDSMAVVRVVLPSSLIDAMATADNRGERILVRALAEAVALAHNISMASADLEAWADEVTADPALKMMHVTTADDAGLVLDHLTERRPCRQLQAPDIAAASGGMRDRLDEHFLGTCQRSWH